MAEDSSTDGTDHLVVAGWVLEHGLGSGGHAEVWRARSLDTGLVRAIKLVRPINLGEQAGGTDGLKAWHHEVQRLEDLSHPHILRFYDAGKVREGPYREHAWITTELCAQSLAGVLARREPRHPEPQNNGQLWKLLAGTGQLASGQADELLDQVLAALAAAHQKGVVHRDVKPANFLQHEDGTWKLGDFGIARLIDPTLTHTGTQTAGTTPYLSRAALDGEQGHAADLYALGVTLHEALTGCYLHPWPEGMTAARFIAQVLATDPTVSPDLPDHWRAIISRLITAPDTPTFAAEYHEYLTNAEKPTSEIHPPEKHPDSDTDTDGPSDTDNQMPSGGSTTEGPSSAWDEMRGLASTAKDLAKAGTWFTRNRRLKRAETYRSEGRYQEAIDLNEGVLADRVRVLGVDHPDTLATRHRLASAYASVGRYQEAIDLNEGVLADRVRVLGVDHPDTLTTRHNLALSYISAGRTDEAITLQGQLVAGGTPGSEPVDESESWSDVGTDPTPFTAEALLPPEFTSDKAIDFAQVAAGARSCEEALAGDGPLTTEEVVETIISHGCTQAMVGLYREQPGPLATPDNPVLVSVMVFPFPDPAKASEVYEYLLPDRFWHLTTWHVRSRNNFGRLDPRTEYHRWSCIRYIQRYVIAAMAHRADLTTEESIGPWLAAAAEEAVDSSGPQNYGAW